MRPLNVLIVDDEPEFRATLVKRLLRRSVRAREAGGGREALDLLKGGDVDVVVLDVKMPDMDGIETLAHIKRDFSDVEVVLLTGHADLSSAVQGMDGGAFDYLMKPVAMDELLYAIEDAGRRREARLVSPA